MIPKKLWCYWEGPDKPLSVSACISKFNKLHPKEQGWDVLCIGRESAERLPGFPLKQLKNQSPQAVSDWVRLALISQHGGVWADATVVMNTPLDKMKWLDLEANELQGFRVPGPATSENLVMENWLFAAPARHPFVMKWKAEYEKALSMGTEKYCDLVVKQHCKCELVLNALPYLSMHGAFSVVLSKFPNLKMPRMTASDAVNGPLFFLNPKDRINRLTQVKKQFHSQRCSPLEKFYCCYSIRISRRTK